MSLIIVITHRLLVAVRLRLVKAGLASNPSVAYITTVGLYSADNQLLAVGKLSEPLKKTPNDEINVKMRIDY